jgi:molecular chaperone GrpE (heat shock protein)
MADHPQLKSDQTVEALQKQVASLQQLVEQQAKREEMQRGAFDQLYAELKQYKEDFIFQAEKPLLLDLLLFYDSLIWFRSSLESGEMSPKVVGESFQFLIDEFEELLYRRDVLPTQPEDEFNRERQKAVQVVYTDDVSLDWRISRVIKRGFTRGERVLRPEEVILHRYRAPQGSSTD